MATIGIGSLVFIAVTQAFLGLILVYQGSVQTTRVFGDMIGVGPYFIFSVVRIFGPTITGMMIATRIGAGIAAELGSMVVTDQTEALKVSGSDPIDYIVAPRLIATILMMIVLWVFGSLVGIAAGTVMGVVRFDIPISTFLNPSVSRMSDVGVATIKCVLYGTVIPIMAAESGLRARGGSEGVGTATTRAVVTSSFAVIVLELLVSTVAYKLHW